MNKNNSFNRISGPTAYFLKIGLIMMLSITFTQASESNTNRQAIKNFGQSSHCELNFGWMEWKPLQYLDENNHLKGLQIELVREIAKELRCDINFVKSDWKQLIQAVKSGKIDFIPDATKSAQRLKFSYFSIPYRQDTFVIYVRTKDLEKYKQANVQELRHSSFKLSLTNGFLYGDEIEKWQSDEKTNQNLSYSENTKEHIQKLLAGTIDGFLEDPYVMAYNFKKGQMPKEMSYLPVMILGHTSRFMFSKRNITEKQIDSFNEALTKVKSLEKFRRSWFDLN